jgi:tetratricopeptide (TPR) repeat protein
MTEIESKIDLIKKSIKDNDLADARIMGEKLIIIHSANAELNYLLGYVYDKLNLIQRAEEYLNKAINLDSNHYDTLVELSLFYEKNGDYEKASFYRERSFRLANKIS